MFKEGLTITVRERFKKKEPVDTARDLLDQRFGHLGLDSNMIEAFGVNYLKANLDSKNLKNLKIAKTYGRQLAEQFKVSILPSLDQNLAETIQGIFAYGALEITKEILKNDDLSYREKKRQLVFIETFLNKNGIHCEYSKLLVKESKKEVNKRALVENTLEFAKFVFGVTAGILGAEYAEKHMAFLPVAQETVGLAIVIGTSISKLTTKLISQKYDQAKGFDRALSKAQPILLGLGIGMVGHGLLDQMPNNVEAMAKEVSSRINFGNSESVKGNTTIPDSVPEVVNQPEVHEVVNYNVAGMETGGITDIANKFYADAYGQDMTKLILENKDLLTDPSRPGHESASKLVEFLQSNPTFTWRDAMNQSVKEGHATEVSKLFTDALRIIKPGTNFVVPVQ